MFQLKGYLLFKKSMIFELCNEFLQTVTVLPKNMVVVGERSYDLTWTGVEFVVGPKLKVCIDFDKAN